MVDVKTPRIKSSVFFVQQLVVFFISQSFIDSALPHDNLPITSRSQKKDEDIGDEKDSADC